MAQVDYAVKQGLVIIQERVGGAGQLTGLIGLMCPARGLQETAVIAGRNRQFVTLDRGRLFDNCAGPRSCRSQTLTIQAAVNNKVGFAFCVTQRGTARRAIQ